MIPVDTRTFSLPHHTNNAFKVMSELRQHAELCDIVLTVGCEQFRAHRVVLAGCSPYLRAMFTNGMLESNKHTVLIHDIEPQTMSILLDFMYSGTVEITTDNVQSLLQGASLLNMSSLRNVCCQFLQLHLDASNCLGIHSFADMYSCMELEAVARRYIYQHFLEVMKQDEFMQLPEEKLVEILKSDRLQVNQEEQVYQAAVSWIKYARVYLNADPETSCRVFQNVRLPLLDSRFLEEKVTQQDFVRNCMKCQNLVANAVRTKGDNNALATISPRAQPQGIFVVGGRNSIDCQLKSMERYDSLKDQWVPMGSMSIARTAVGAATLNGIIYAVGGECALAQSQDETIYLRCVEAYDPIVKDWYTCADMKVPRSFVAVCAAGRYLYALGGEDRLNSYNIAERYCYKTNTWTFIPNMQRKRAGAGITVCDSKIYIAGGYDKSFHTDRASVECYDPDTQEWSFVAEMEKARSGLALVALDHYLYAFGGRSRHNDQYFDSAERYNTWTHQWTSIATLSTPRAWPSAVAMDNHIYVLGGFDGSNRLRSVELYDPESDTWAYINSMNVSRAGGAATVL